MRAGTRLGHSRGFAEEPCVVNKGNDFYGGKFVGNLFQYRVLGKCEKNAREGVPLAAACVI